VLYPGIILCVVVAYLLGSIPTGFLVAKAKGIDIRSVGSGNIGATNVFRYFGKTAGALVLLADAAKGLAAVLLAAHVFAPAFIPASQPQFREGCSILAALAAVLGHNYTVWLYFKGGKGIATSAGALAALVPWSLLIIFFVWLIVFVATRYVSLASIAASASLPLAAWITHESPRILTITALMAALAIYKHKENIQRLLAGTEHRFTRVQHPKHEQIR
jgi:acyl phosphate:glycerol-3-phosphate acyltransferase